MNTLHESSKRTAARWARISQLPRKRRRHQTRQERAGLIRNLMRQDGR